MVERGERDSAVSGPARSAVQRALESLARGVPAHGEHNPLESTPGIEVPANLFNLDPRRLIEREASHARAQRDER
jgi:hypothetical protein